MQFEELIKRVAQALDHEHLPYMLLGGQAVLRYGTPRLTEDIDISLGVSPTEGSRVLEMLGALSLTPLVDDPLKFLQETFVLPVLDSVTGIRLDIIFSLSDYERQAIGRARRFEIDSVPVNYISIEDLIIYKLIASRPRDLEDIASVIRKNPEYDEGYVLGWLKEYDKELETELEKAYLQFRHCG